MNKPNKSWFHCGHCGGLFQDQPGARPERTCPECGIHPATSTQAPQPQPATIIPAPRAKSPSSPHHQGKRSVRKRKRNYLMLKLVLAWAVLIALIIGGARILWPEGDEVSSQVAIDANQNAINRRDDHRIVNEAFPGCNKALSLFLDAGDNKQRGKFVLHPVITVPRMDQFYGQNPSLNLKKEAILSTTQALLHLPDNESAIEVHAVTNDSRKVDIIFRKELDEWRIDWDHLVRYSDYPWSLFLAGSGPDQGEFRLLARERLANQRKESSDLSLVLYAPRFGRPEAPGFQSPEFLVPRHSQNGKILEAAFKLAAEGKRPFNSTLPTLDPDSIIRICASIRRKESDQGREFEIVEVRACHWMAVDDPGVEIRENPPEPAETQDP